MKKVILLEQPAIATVTLENTKESNFYFLVWDSGNGCINNYILERNDMGNWWKFTNLRTGTTFNGGRSSFLEIMHSTISYSERTELYEFESLSELLNWYKHN